MCLCQRHPLIQVSAKEFDAHLARFTPDQRDGYSYPQMFCTRENGEHHLWPRPPGGITVVYETLVRGTEEEKQAYFMICENREECTA